jgi:hypothetical protein
LLAPATDDAAVFEIASKIINFEIPPKKLLVLSAFGGGFRFSLRAPLWVALRLLSGSPVELLPSMKAPSRFELVKLSRVILLCAGVWGAAGQSALAVNAAWNIDAASSNFNTPQWTSDVTVPVAGGTYIVVSGDALFFGTRTTGATAITNDLTDATFNGLTFNTLACAFTIGGNSFTLNGNIAACLLSAARKLR